MMSRTGTFAVFAQHVLEHIYPSFTMQGKSPPPPVLTMAANHAETADNQGGQLCGYLLFEHNCF
jgi:hypothetical protein